MDAILPLNVTYFIISPIFPLSFHPKFLLRVKVLLLLVVRLHKGLHVCYDNHSTIERVQNSIYNNKSRHMCHKYNIVEYLLSNGIIFIGYVRSKKNIVDPLAKCIVRELIYSTLRRINLKPLKIKKCYDDNAT